jgi:uncharacterized membrane protein YgcG
VYIVTNFFLPIRHAFPFRFFTMIYFNCSFAKKKKYIQIHFTCPLHAAEESNRVDDTKYGGYSGGHGGQGGHGGGGGYGGGHGGGGHGGGRGGGGL